MTTRRFDAPASTTPARRFVLREYARAKAATRRVVRLVWLAVLLARKDFTGFADYRRRFGIDMPTFRRDLRTVRRAEAYTVWYLTGDFRSYRYLAETEHE
ncbi:MAG TPA: hypothetical protein VFF00_05460 [Candidatus Elarobacter sp.]|nr:hypothetical protein [Candidatus Elarobacter sp.]